MAVQIKRYTTAEFETFVVLPENADRLFELIGGEIVEVPSNPYSSQISILIAAAILAFVRSRNLGHVTGEAGGYRIAGERYAPDVAFISYAKQPELAREGYNPIPPDLVVEVVSPTDDLRQVSIKISNYLAVGTWVWIVYPDVQEVVVHQAGEAVRVFTMKDTLDGGAILPGFTLAIKDIFPPQTAD